MAEIECYISPFNGVRYRVGVTYSYKGFTFHKSKGKWDFAFSISRRDINCLDYCPVNFPSDYKKATERFIKELEKAYKLTKRTKRVKMGLSDNGSANVGRNDLRLEVYVVE